MRTGKNVFYYFVQIIYLILILVMIAGVTMQTGNSAEYQGLQKLLANSYAAAGILLLVLGTYLYVRLNISEAAGRHVKTAEYAELILSVMVLAVAVIIRTGALNRVTELAGQENTAYQIALDIKRGTLLTEGTHFCDLIAIFPHLYFYPVILAGWFSIAGESIYAAQILNVVLAAGVIFLAGRTVRILSGRAAEILVMLLLTFWPAGNYDCSHISGNMLFDFLMMLSLYLFTVLVGKKDTEHAWLNGVLYFLLGIVIGLGMNISRFAMVVLIAYILWLLPYAEELPAIMRNDIPLGMRVIDRGWKRGFLVLIGFLITILISIQNVSYATDRSTAPSETSWGYALMTGMNTETGGKALPQDLSHILAAYAKTGYAEDAQKEYLSAAVTKIQSEPAAVLNLIYNKIIGLYGTGLSAEQAGTLLVILILCGITAICGRERNRSTVYAAQLILIGAFFYGAVTPAHSKMGYGIMCASAVLTGAAIRGLMDEIRNIRVADLYRLQELASMEQQKEEHIAFLKDEEGRLEKLRIEAMKSQFDMQSAIEAGHVKIVMSEGAAAAAEKKNSAGEKGEAQ
ncbi:MAG: glycosyltransferase family 39 protein [Butyrivibrio sp.]|jgi:hypothetical protein|nr:glycosyltransferase family 39 protein [Butyrivibrio sp.]